MRGVRPNRTRDAHNKATEIHCIGASLRRFVALGKEQVRFISAWLQKIHRRVKTKRYHLARTQCHRRRSPPFRRCAAHHEQRWHKVVCWAPPWRQGEHSAAETGRRRLPKACKLHLAPKSEELLAAANIPCHRSYGRVVVHTRPRPLRKHNR